MLSEALKLSAFGKDLPQKCDEDGTLQESITLAKVQQIDVINTTGRVVAIVDVTLAPPKLRSARCRGQSAGTPPDSLQDSTRFEIQL